MTNRTSVVRLSCSATAHFFTALEVLTVYACILLYIWRWQSSHHLAWIPMLVFVLLTHWFHHDRPDEMGLTLHELRGNARLILPLAAAIYAPVIVLALARHRDALFPSGKIAIERFLTYGVWCCFQQYLMQSYFHRRLRSLMHTPHLSSALVAIMFAGAHLPNLLLVAITAGGGFIMAKIFARRPNIWPLALAQAVGGILVAAVAPPALIRDMRVGPGYWKVRPGPG